MSRMLPTAEEPDAIPDTPRLLFDEAIVAKFKELTIDTLLEYPELRTVAVVLDWRNSLNLTAQTGFWWGDRGDPRTPDEVYGSMSQSLKMLDHQFTVCAKLLNSFQQASAQLGEEITKRNEQVQEAQRTLAGLERQIREREEQLQEQPGGTAQ